MGKKIIIKGADFSVNGFKGEPSYWQGNTKLAGVSLNSVSGTVKTVAIGLQLNEALNKPINCVKVAVNNSFLGKTFSVFRASLGDSVDTPFTSLADFTVTADDVTNGYAVVVLNETVTITSTTETLMVGVLNNTAGDSVSILPLYQVESGGNHSYFQVRGTQTIITKVSGDVARWVMSYGIV